MEEFLKWKTNQIKWLEKQGQENPHPSSGQEKTTKEVGIIPEVF